MNEKSPVTEFIEKFLDHGSTYKVGKRVVVIEPMEDYWRERTAMFLAAVILHIKETCSADRLFYPTVYYITKAAWRMEQDELSAIFATPEASKYYAAFCEKSDGVTKTVLISAYTQMQAIRFDRQRITEFERVFELC